MKKNLKKVLAIFVLSCIVSTQLASPVFAAKTSNYAYWYTEVKSTFTPIGNKKKITSDRYSTASFWTGGGVVYSTMYGRCYFDGSACTSEIRLPKGDSQVQMVYNKSNIGLGKAIIIKAKTDDTYMADGHYDVR